MATNISFNVPELPELINSEIPEQNPDGKAGDDSDVVNSQSSELTQALIKRLNANTDHRAGLVEWIKILIPVYLIVVLLILLYNGFTDIKFYLSDEIILAILCTTTANIIGLAVIVLKGLFGSKQQ